MRLRKTLKRTAAATLALSMALSAAAPAVTAAYICDVSQGSVNITVDADGSKTIQVGGQKVEDDGDGTDDIIITGDNTQAPASQNDAVEPAPAETEDEEAPAEEDAAPADEAEAPETADAEGTEDAAADDADAEDAAAEPATLELSAPAVDTGDEAEDTPAEPERTVTETEDGTVIEYGDYTVDPDVQVTKPEPAPEAAAPAEKAAEPEDETVTYEAPAEENTSVVSSVVENVVKIVNNYKDALNIILRNLKVDAGTSKEDAMNISGTGDVTLELDGKNELIGGSGVTTGKWSFGGNVGNGLDSRQLSGALTITGSENPDATLTVKGGDNPEDSSKEGSLFVKAGDGLYANKLVIEDTSVTSIGGYRSGDVHSNYRSGNGISTVDLTITGSTVVAKGGDSQSVGGIGLETARLTMTDSSLSATGGSAASTDSEVTGGTGLTVSGRGDEYLSISNSHISAIGGNAISANGDARGGKGSDFDNPGPGFHFDHVTFLNQGGNASSDTGSAKGGNGFNLNSRTSSIAGEFVVIGGNATTVSGTAEGGNGYYSFCYYASGKDSSLCLTSGSFTAIGGSGSTANGSSIFYGTEWGSGYSPMKISDDVNLNVYQTGDDAFTLQDYFVPSDHGAFTYYKNATVIQNEDGSVTVTGEPFRYVNDGHVYTIASRTATTIIWHCEDEGVEDLELPIPAGSTFDAMKHEWVTSEDGTYEECTICHLQRAIPQPEPDQPNTPSNDTTAAAVPAALHLRVVDANGADVAFETRTESGNYIVDARRDGLDTATLIAPLPVLRELQASGAESITFVTNLKTTTLSLSALLALGSEDDEAQLLHTGDVPTLTVGGTVHNELL